MKDIIHKFLWIILLVFCIAGLFYPIIGLVAVICMLGPSVYALFKGNRGWCGTYCPRGSFNDIILNKISLKGRLPLLLKTKAFRLLFLITLMLAFAVQIALAWGSIYGIGMVFVRMIIITTILTIILGIAYQPRAWCVFCPMGTMAHYVIKSKGKINSPIKFDKEGCISCKKCNKSCPMQIDLLSYKSQGIISSADCIRCQSCIAGCPKNILFI